MKSKLSANKTETIWARFGRYLALLSFLILILGMLSTSYFSALLLLIGVVSGVLVWLLAKKLFPVIKSHFLSIVVHTQGWAWPRWIQKLSTVLVLWPFSFFGVVLIFIYLLDLISFYPSDFIFFSLLFIFSLLLSILASAPVQSFLSFLSAQVQNHKWQGWIWIQRFLMVSVFFVFFFPLVFFLLLILPWDTISSLDSLSYSTVGLALVLSILLTWRCETFLGSVASHTQDQMWQRWIWRQRFLIMLIWAVFFCSLWVLVLVLVLLSSPQTMSLNPPAVETYHVVIEPTDQTLRSFRVREEIVPYFSPSGKQTLSRQVISTSRGFLLREVRIEPLEADSSGYVNLTLSDGTVISNSLCGDYCPKSTIELRDFPKNSYYDAKDAEVETTDTYIDTETISLSVNDLSQGIVFAYIPPPYHHLRPLLAPFVGLSSVGEFAVTSVGLICTLIVLPIIQPALSDVIKEKFKSRFKKVPQKQEGKKATLIVSDKGEEKEIDIIE